MTISVRRYLERKTMLVSVKEYIIKNFATCKSLCNLQKLYTVFKEKYPNVTNIGFSKFCAFRAKWCVLAGSKKTHSVYVCSAHQNNVLLVHAMDWDLTYKDLIKKIVCNTESNKCIMHRCESCPGTETLQEFPDQELNEHKDEKKFNYCQWDTTDQAILTTFAAHYEEYKDTLTDVTDDLIRHSYITMIKIFSGVKITASYILWVYTTWYQMVATNMIHCVLVLMTTTITQAVCIKFKK